MPRADDLPSFRIDHTNTPCTHNPLGVKGCGEAGAIGSPPAFINALTDALGVRDIDAGDPRTCLACRQRHRLRRARAMYAFDYQRPASTSAAAAAWQGEARFLAGDRA